MNTDPAIGVKIPKGSYITYVFCGIIALISVVSIIVSIIVMKKNADDKTTFSGSYNTAIDKLNTSSTSITALKESLTNLEKFQKEHSMPVGSVSMFYLTENPDQYLPFIPCDGRQLDKSKYPELSNLLDGKYNLETTDSNKYFNLPNIAPSNASNEVRLNTVKSTLVLNNTKGPLPLQGQFSSFGGNLVVFMKYSLWSQVNDNTSTGLNVLVDNTVVNQVKTYVRSLNDHVERSHIFMLNNIAAGVHTLALSVTPSTNTVADQNDSFTVICMELAPVSVTPPLDIFDTFLTPSNMGLFIKAY